VATTITVGSAGTAIGGQRCSVNNHVFIEVESVGIATGTNDCKIRAGVGSSIITLESWTPADNSFNHEHLSQFRAVVSQHPDANEWTKTYNDGTSFGEGTFTQTQVTGDALALAINSPLEDFESHATGTTLDSIADWTRSSTGYYYVRDQSYLSTMPSTPENQYVYGTIYNGYIHYRYEGIGNTNDVVIITARVFSESTSGSSGSGLAVIPWHTTGVGSSFRGHGTFFYFGDNLVGSRRFNSNTSTYGFWSGRIGITLSQNTWYWVKVKAHHTGSSVYCYWKKWADGDSEPADWQWGGSDTAYVYAGYPGIGHQSGVNVDNIAWDDFSVVPDPPSYYASGEWESGLIDTTGVGQYSGATIGWTPTTPTGTTIAVKARWRNGGTWLACTNGALLPGIDVGEDVSAGSSKDSLELKVELDTTDTGETPTVADLEVYQEPVADDALRIDLTVGSKTIEHVTADGSLAVEGKQIVSGSANISNWDDLKLETYQPYHLFAAGAFVTAELWYGPWMVDDIVVQLMRDYWKVASLEATGYYSLNPIKYASAPVQIRWNCQTPWFNGGKRYDWVLIDYSLGNRQDYTYLVGHYQLDDIPGFYIAGALNFGDNPGFYLAKGYKRDDQPGFFLSQAWRRDDQPGFYMPGIITNSDQPGMFIIAVRELHDQPGSFQVMGVNRDGVIEVTIVKDDLWTELAARGYTRG
jgi:hypothetical protein